MSLPEQQAPTHILTIRVPLNLSANSEIEGWDLQRSLHEALKAILPMVRLGTLQLLCDDIEVQLKEADG